MMLPLHLSTVRSKISSMARQRALCRPAWGAAERPPLSLAAAADGDCSKPLERPALPG